MQNSDRRLIYPTYSKESVNKAAKAIVMALSKQEQINPNDECIIENWRASHTHVLNTWQVILRKRIKTANIVFAQRLKRKNTIYDKLVRYPDMNLARMHDIAGCRLIFKSEEELLNYRQSLHSAKQIKHILKTQECKNYIVHPKKSGYRGIHDIYLYKSRQGYDRSDKWNGLSVEIQYRTIYQHAWATAVEVVDSIDNERLKFSEGGEKQQEFFKLASEIIARVYENKTSCKPELTDKELLIAFNAIEQDIGLLDKLRALKAIHKHKEKILEKNAIIIFDANTENGICTLVKPFNNLKLANNTYFQLEKEMPTANIVLVTSDDKRFSNSIKNAYRNYFADTKDFTKYVEDGINLLK